ncbi:hypothetical protein LSAT2_018210 [Lamellibrachia satsuma]|nr:hypothetical protein LSAT2_018210 [Lamellibrachia satsuma]
MHMIVFLEQTDTLSADRRANGSWTGVRAASCQSVRYMSLLYMVFVCVLVVCCFALLTSLLLGCVVCFCVDCCSIENRDNTATVTEAAVCRQESVSPDNSTPFVQPTFLSQLTGRTKSIDL